MKNNFRNKISFLLIVIALLLVISCGDKKNESTNNNDSINSDSLVIEIAGQTGQSVFEVTFEKHTVDFVESSMGVFVKAIDSVASTRKFTWIFSVNDSFVPVGSNDYITNDTDVIKWHFRKF